MIIVYILIAIIVFLLAWFVIALIWGKPWSIKLLMRVLSSTLL